jgi:peptidoglycan hydrolase CwlO-like protein
MSDLETSLNQLNEAHSKAVEQHVATEAERDALQSTVTSLADARDVATAALERANGELAVILAECAAERDDAVAYVNARVAELTKVRKQTNKNKHANKQTKSRKSI